MHIRLDWHPYRTMFIEVPSLASLGVVECKHPALWILRDGHIMCLHCHASGTLSAGLAGGDLGVRRFYDTDSGCYVFPEPGAEPQHKVSVASWQEARDRVAAEKRTNQPILPPPTTGSGGKGNGGNP